MSSLVEVSTPNEPKDGTMKDVSVDGREILLARVGDKYYAADNRCPHMGGKLSQGKLEGTVATCPLHGSQFDLRDGHVVRWLKRADVSTSKIAGKRLRIYNVKVEDGKILIET